MQSSVGLESALSGVSPSITLHNYWSREVAMKR